MSTNRVAVVTGAGSGIGAAVAGLLASRGCQLALIDVDEASLARTQAALPAPSRAIRVVADVSQEDDVDRAFSEARDHFGEIHLLHNNAGVLGEFAPLVEASVESFERTLGINARGAFLTLQAFFRRVGPQGTGGAVVNMSSVAALRGRPGRVAYTMSKSAVLGLTTVGALEGQPLGIRVNAVCPGRIDTPMIADGSVPRGQPSNRLGTALEVAYLVAWLLSDEASLVTGGVYPVDGGSILDS